MKRKLKFKGKIKFFSRYFFVFCGIGLFLSCKQDLDPPLRDKAWVPIYVTHQEASIIKSVAVRTPKFGGKIYAYQNHFFQLEPNQGIHIYTLDANNKLKPEQFLQIYGSHEISIRNSVLYSNNYNDIVSVSISDLTNIKELGRVKNVFESSDLILPPESGYFECVDPAKGKVIGWELKNNVRVKCKTLGNENVFE